jgi:REP element-mobilizing transposase RayT
MARMRRFENPGGVHHIMSHSINNESLFIDDSDRKFFVKRLSKVLEETNCLCLAWSLLTNHYHLMIRTSGENLKTIMRKLNTSYAQYFNQRYKRRGHLFQDRYKSLVCYEQEYYFELLLYIHLNPLRVGIVNTKCGDLKEGFARVKCKKCGKEMFVALLC